MKKLGVGIKDKIFKMSTVFSASLLTFLFATSGVVNADVITDYSGDRGDIGNSTIFTGLYSLISNVAGTLQWIIPIAGVAWILWYVFRIMTGDEQDQQRYKKGLVKVLICIVVAEVAVVLINLIAGYFGT